MAENILALKKRAVKAGMDKNAAKKAGRVELEKYLASGSKKASPAKKNSPAKKASSSKPAKKQSDRKQSRKPVAAKKTATKKAPTAKKSAAKTSKSKRQAAENNGSGRLAIGQIDWTVTSDEWNPKAGGPVEGLFKALKKSRGDVDKAFDALKPHMYDYVGKKKRDGSKRTKDEAESMLRYRLNRTKFEFARRTGQHESATDRVEYGTGQYAQATKKSNRKAARENTGRKNDGRKTTAKGKKAATAKKGSKPGRKVKR